MARSRKKPWVGDRKWREYFRPIRRRWKTVLQTTPNDEEPELPLTKELVNDYDYQDYKWLVTGERKEKYSRK